MPLETQLDQTVEKAAEGQAGNGPQFGIHADFGEAGKSVDLVHVKVPGPFFEEEIDAGQTLGLAGLEGGDRLGPYFSNDGGGQLGRMMAFSARASVAAPRSAATHIA